MDPRGKEVYVGLSGGVDSAVTAALLQQAGANVTGVFIKGWYPPGMPCTWSADRRDAMRVAARLQIPFNTLDASLEYKKSVIDYLLKEYKEGRTPNPDIMCNREVKFGAFYRFAKERGADYIATGHYARTSMEALLERGVSREKDQSYFLWAVPKEALGMTLFPLGSMEKSEVRRLAHTFRLPVEDKPDSQGICFLGDISVEDFLRSEFGAEPGTALDENGVIVGKHSGATLHTLGERVRIEGDAPGPWFVVAKDVAENVLHVAHEPKRFNGKADFTLTDSNWLEDPTGKTLTAQYRYHGPEVAAKVSADKTSVRLTGLTEAVADGQSIVLYDGDRVIGGGIIASASIEE